MNIREDQFDPDKVKVRTEPGWLKLIGPDGPLRLIPSDKICLVQYAEVEEESRILKPTAVPQPKFQPS